MIKLTKTSATSWNGNGFGSSAAEWAVKGQEHIVLRQLGVGWTAINTESNQRIAKAYTKKDLCEVLATKI
jgi:hypothetical protein